MTQFETIEPGKYAATITLRSGATRRILVKKVQAMNPSVRGGAYKTEWKAYNGGLYVSETADTRQAAFDKAIEHLKTRNMI
jgi:hypothetical protein